MVLRYVRKQINLHWLAFINDVRTFLSKDDDEVKNTVANIRALKKRFEDAGVE